MEQNWQIKKLNEVSKIIMGQSPPSDTYNENAKGMPFFQGKAEFTDLYPVVKKYCSKPTKIAEPLDILLSVRAPVGTTNIANQQCCIGRGLAAIRFENYKYGFYFLRSIQHELDSKGTGTTFKAISGETIRETLIPFPNPETQQAIVSKIEELFSELDKGIEDLKTAQQQLKTYRQSVLKWAFEGKLTKNWRLKKVDIQSSSDITNKILLEKEAFYLKQLNEWKKELVQFDKNNIKKPSKPKSLTIPDKPSDLHNEKKWEIPSNWLWTQLGTICFVTKLAGFEYTDYVKYDDNGNLPVLKAENVGNNGFKYTDFSKVKSESVEMLKRSKLHGGELLIVFVGAGTGNIGTVPTGEYFLGPNIGMARPYIDANSKYIEYFYQSTIGKSLMMTAVKAVAQPSLSMATIRQAPIPLPQLEEQHQIVQEIESRLSVADKMEESIAQSLQQAEALRQSILKKAFSGELV
ncbi:restriction endonuclease subunit S [Flavobacterium sp.]|uniref:restriction endonuclease subunit S n=1 Tax=Flavobacterium sp. TaxID=239 RepID=UPI00261C6F19|nr:restriction endonuclease subunit S [Flavobacterium sp.]